MHVPSPIYGARDQPSLLRSDTQIGKTPALLAKSPGSFCFLAGGTCEALLPRRHLSWHLVSSPTRASRHHRDTLARVAASTRALLPAPRRAWSRIRTPAHRG